MVIAEIAANRWKKAGHAEVAGAFKRAAHLAYGSLLRWQRPSGEMWIVKNRAEPSRRFGYLGYSFHSQYNLIASAMLALAAAWADDSIDETPAGSERGGYVFDLRRGFHKVVAAAGGYYLEIDGAANGHYQGTGLLRVHRAGVPLSPLNDSTAPFPWIGGAEKTQEALSPGIQWRVGDRWCGLAQFTTDELLHFYPGQRSVGKWQGRPTVAETKLSVLEETADRVRLAVEFRLTGHGARPIRESWTVEADGVEGTSELPEGAEQTRVIFPALISDGAVDFSVTVTGSRLTIRRDGGELTWEVTEPRGVELRKDESRQVTQNGFVQKIYGELPRGAAKVKWKLRLAQP